MLLAWIRERAQVVGRGNAVGRAVGLGFATIAVGIVGLVGLLRGYGDPYHAAMRLDALGWVLLGGGLLAFPALLRAWMRARHAVSLHGGTSGGYLLPEGLVVVAGGRLDFRPRTAVSRFWRWETVDQEGDWMSDDLHVVFQDGFGWDVPLEGQTFQAFKAAQRRGGAESGLEALLDSLSVGPEPPMPHLARFPILRALLIAALLVPAVGSLRDRQSDHAAFRRALEDRNDYVWVFYAFRTRLHKADAEPHLREANEADRRRAAEMGKGAR